MWQLIKNFLSLIAKRTIAKRYTFVFHTYLIFLLEIELKKV